MQDNEAMQHPAMTRFLPRLLAACLFLHASWTLAADGVATRQILIGQNITLQGGKNDYGAASSLHVLGVELLNESFSMGIDDLALERVYTYIALGVRRMKKFDMSGRRIGGEIEAGGGDGKTQQSESDERHP